MDQRLEAILGLLYREGEILSLEKSIQQRVRRQMEKAQREYYLREQIKAIQVELGERDEKGKTETEEMKERLQEAKLPKEAKAKVLHEIHRLERMPPCPRKPPWSAIISTGCSPALVQADEGPPGSEHGRGDPQRGPLRPGTGERAHLEFLAVRQLTKNSKGRFSASWARRGGQDLLAQSVGKALNRNFARLSWAACGMRRRSGA